MPIVAVKNASSVPAAAAAAPLPTYDGPASAAAALLDQVLNSGADGAGDTILVRACGEESETLRGPALQAGLRMARFAGDKASALLSQLEEILDHLPANAQRAERVMAAVLEIMGELGERLNLSQLTGVLSSRLVPHLGHDSDLVAAGASRGFAACVRGGLAAGLVAQDGPELAELFSASMKSIREAKTPAEGRSGAFGLGAVLGGAGIARLVSLDVIPQLMAIVDGKVPKEAPCCREAAVLGLEQLSLQLGCAFEPYGIPLLRKLVALYADKDKKVADAAAKGVRALLAQLSPLAVKLVLPALYDGMAAVQWRTQVECLTALAVLAEHAPTSVGPRLPEAIPQVMECLASTNANVVKAASSALPLLCSCVDNPETQKLKPLLIEAFIHPETTLDCLDELLCTTFVNAMDGTSLAFIMPLLLRGLGDAKYELVKKAALSSGNVCALVKNPSEIAPYVAAFEPALTKCLDHSSPDVRAAAEIAKQKLLDGTEGLDTDLEKRPKAIAAHLSQQLGVVGGAALAPKLPAEVIAYLADLGAELLEQELGGAVKASLFLNAPKSLASLLAPSLAMYADAPPSEEALTKMCEGVVAAFKELLSDASKSILASADGVDYAVDVQNAILAFAGRVLLKGCDLRFQRGHRYGLIGQNGVGKTTLLNRMAAKDITGFPQDVRTWYIRHEVVCEDGITVSEFMKQQSSADDAKVKKTLDDVGFPPLLQAAKVQELSGGWKMKLSIAISIVQQPELLLLDEPTNHLDRNAVDWLKEHLLSLKGVTICVVSHDYDFIDEVCTDIAHYDNGGIAMKPCRFVYYPMKFREFQALKPEIAAGLPTADKAIASLLGKVGADEESSDGSMSKSSSIADGMADLSVGEEGPGATIARVDEMIASGQILPIVFPDPGKPEGIRTYRKPIMTMQNISFKYPDTERWILTDATVTVTLGSRAVLLGANGAGKTTFLKLLVGDLELEAEQGHKGEAWRHHNLRVSYIAQHSLHHLEEYLNETPLHYIQERFRLGMDKELAKLKTMALTEDEKALMTDIGMVCEVTGRQQRGKAIWYEVVKTGRKKSDTQYFPLDEIKKDTVRFPPYVMKLIRNYDEKQAAIDSGMAIRPITSTEILAHLADFGIPMELAHGKIKQMSGGQRQRLVICAAFWSKPHLIALDEPTNYLDNDTLAALTQALKTFKGAVVTVSHNEAFVAEISNEKWIVEGGQITCIQLRDQKAR